ncbi:MAG: lipopolysaccharide heptosyltransferase II [Candidatus Omnitrophica bacterium]|nr:lipopolysaccharide heptosyltransferase II [Candidatus Omnitrophota bacterium]
MNILQVVPRMEVGGVETGTLDLARSLVKRGHKAVVVSAGGRLVPELERASAVHYTLPVHRKNLPGVWLMAGRLAEIIRKESIDVVHARSRIPALSAYLACRRCMIPLVTTAHGYYSTHLVSRIMGQGKRVIVISEAVGQHMMDQFGVPLRKIRLVHRGVNLEQFPYAPSRPEERKEEGPLVGVIGRLTPIKGHETFLKAFARVARVLPRARAVIVGSPERGKENYAEQIKLLIRQLGLTRQVELRPSTDRIGSVYSELDLLVLPSTGPEAFGRVLIEASAAGVPVLASRIGGIVDAVEDGVTGVLTPPGNPQILADSIVKLLRDPGRMERLRVSARRRVEKKFSLDRMVDKTLAVYEEVLAESRVLIIKYSALGDIVLGVPSLRAIRKAWPEAHITLLTSKEIAPMMASSPYVNEVMVLDRSGTHRGVRGIWRMGRILRGEGFDISIDLQNNRSSHALSFLSGAIRRYGYENGKWSFLLNYTVPLPKEPLPPIQHQARVLGRAKINVTDESLELWAKPEDRERIEVLLKQAWLRDNQVLVALHPGSGSWPTKRWDLEHFAELCDELGKRSVRCVLVGTKKEGKLGAKIAQVSGSKPIELAGKTSLGELVALFRRCSALVCGDSAPLHVAAAVGLPTVALFGPTEAERHIPPAPCLQVIQKEVPCGPCYRTRCSHITCMKSISPREVLDALNGFLEKSDSVHGDRAEAGIDPVGSSGDDFEGRSYPLTRP